MIPLLTALCFGPFFVSRSFRTAVVGLVVFVDPDSVVGIRDSAIPVCR